MATTMNADKNLNRQGAGSEAPSASAAKAVSKVMRATLSIKPGGDKKEGAENGR